MISLAGVPFGALALVIANISTLAQSANPLVGAWKLTSFQQQVLKDGSVISPQGEKPQGRLVYTANSQFATMSTTSDRKIAGPDMTDERLALFKTMYAFSGTYKVEGNQVTTTTDISWRPDWVGRKATGTFKIEGDKLSLESAPFRNVRGDEVVATTVYAREE